MTDPARPTRVRKKDRTGVFISVAVHIGAIAVAIFILSQTDVGRELWMRTIGATRDEKKKAPPPKAAEQKAAAPKGPRKVSTEAPPPANGPRRVVDEAPPSADSGLSVEDRAKSKGGQGAVGGSTNTIAAAPPLPPKLVASRPVFQSAATASTVAGLLAERAKASSSVEAIGSEQIAKSGISDAGAVVTKIAGATISDGKFAVIRGLNDRYITTTLNGANLPSADPYRQSAPLDLFPAQVIDRVVVTKTFTPDQQGTSTGGGIDVVTKSFPERDFLTVSLGGDYNTQASLNDRFLTYNGGSHDWAGMDDGSRALPNEVNSLAPPGKRFPDAPISSGVINSPLYFQSLSNAAVLDKVSRALGVTEFAPRREAAPLNHNFSLAGGGTTHLLDGPLGYFVGMSYKHDYSFYEDGVNRRYQSGTTVKSDYTDTRSLSVVNWSGMVNLAYQPFENHELGFTFFYNQNGTDEARRLDAGTEANSPGARFRKFNLYYTERNLNTYQMKGEHRLVDLAGLQFNWLFALTKTSQDEPDARFFNDSDTGSGFASGGNGVPAPSKPTRYFRTLDENNRNLKLDWTLPFHHWTEEPGKFKFGLFDSYSERDFTERQFYYPGHGGYQDDPNRYLVESQLGLVSVRTNFLRGTPRSLTFNWGDYVQIFDSVYNGTRAVQAGYLMLDLPAVDKLRLVGGVRYESTDLFVHSESYIDSSITSKKTNDTHLVQSGLLPSAGLVYSLTPKMNVRANYSQTIARPSFRELAAYYSYDPIVSDFVEGNPLLKLTSSDNYDLRCEWFPRPGELFSVSLFYKDIKDAIERGNVKQEGDVITFFNNDATLYGAEFEARKNLDFLGAELVPFSIGGNLSLVQSEVKLKPNDLASKRQFFPHISSTRPLYDQSPYVFNADLSYSNPGAGTTASLVYNVAGPRIAIAKLNTEDVYDQPAAGLDFVISQKLGRNTTLKFGAKNLLNPTIERTYGKDSGLIYSSYKKGRSFGVSLSYNF